jgi:D-alanyl-D-alanine dipeptidase
MLKKFFIISYFFILLVFPVFIFAQTAVKSETTKDAKVEIKGIEFKPSINIPNSIFTKKIVVTGDTLGNYIVAVYRYGGIFAGIVAMFMLVYAGWEWLLAGGNSGKISQAKEKINGVLIGLALLFGGYLLLSVISTNLISFKSLNATLPNRAEICAIIADPTECTKNKCLWTPATTDQIAQDPSVKGTCSAKNINSTGLCPSASMVKAINVPGIIINQAECKDPRLTGETISKLLVAKSNADSLGYTLVINGALRDSVYQQFLYDCYMTVKNGNPCPAGACGKCNLASPPDCEKSSHMQGIAVDICAKKNNGSMDTCLYVDEAHNCTSPTSPDACAAVPNLYQAQDDLKTIMVNAGFKKDVVREWWHFTNK